MLGSNGFDLWADSYDKSVEQSQESGSYPFAGYRRVLGTIYGTIRAGQGRRVLDVGIGTAVLAQRLYQDGYEIWGLDFSEKMLEGARQKMPEAVLLRHDFSRGLPPELSGERFDYIVCTYAIHHLDEAGKAALLRALQELLNPGGLILVGDVAFETAAELARCREAHRQAWDEEEYYMVAEDMGLAVPGLRFEKISFCAGVFTLGAEKAD